MAPSLSDSPLLFDLPLRPDFSLERRARRDGLWPVAGVDEAGRGPLAGPVVAAAVILDPERIPDGLDDSKRLQPEVRITIFEQIMSRALAVSIASLCAGTIDCSDIRLASLEAMRRAVATLSLPPLTVLADGRDIPPGLACQCKALVKGDQRSQSVAAASIIAKVIRDRTMKRAGQWDDRYGFDSHAGYATARHREALVQHGPVMRMHRMTFAPCKQ